MPLVMPHTHTHPSEPDKACPLCPRLVAFREEYQQKEPDWFNGAVPSMGPETAELLIIGLAPGLRGANRTGKPFTGDASGDLLFKTLDKCGFLSGSHQAAATGDIHLKNTMITNAVRCVPPQNKPTAKEINACRPFLQARLSDLPRLKAVVMLGRIAHDATIRSLGLKPKEAPFAHGAIAQTELEGRPLMLCSSYHCSRYNVNTRRLTEDMFETVFARVQTHLTR